MPGVEPTHTTPTPTPLTGHLPPGRSSLSGVPLADALTLPYLLDQRYELREVLGRGGMAVVYLAVDLRSGGTRRAVKLLLDERLGSESAQLRFRNEMAALQMLNHPNVVRYRHAGELGGFSYMVMDYLEGGNLHEKAANKLLTAHESLKLLGQLLRALQAAHDKGVVHRDVKPHNVLLDTHGQAYLTDFGIAQITHKNTELTATGASMGTAVYMAPEQYLDAKAVDGRADQYATAATIFTVLTGQKPFALYHEQLDGPRFLAVDERLRGVLWQATRYNPSDRFESAREMYKAARLAWSGDWAPNVNASQPGLAPSMILAEQTLTGMTVPEDRGASKARLVRSGLTLLSLLALVAALFGIAVMVANPPASAPLDTSSAQAPSPEVSTPLFPESLPLSTVAPSEPVPVVVDPPLDPAPSSASTPVKTSVESSKPAPPIVDKRASRKRQRRARKAKGPVMLNAVPPAEIYIDGKQVGRLFNGELVVGQHTVRLERAGERPVIKVIEVVEGQALKFCWDFRAGDVCARL